MEEGWKLHRKPGYCERAEEGRGSGVVRRTTGKAERKGTSPRKAALFGCGGEVDS